MITNSLRYMRNGVLLMVPLLMLLAGCGPSQQEMMARDRLQKVQAAYNEANANPSVTSNAPVALLDAGKQLKAAESADNYKEMDQLTYIAERKIQTAIAIADTKVAEKEVEKLSKESSSIVLANRERELEKARQDASDMAGKSEQAKLLAESLTQELEQARKTAEEARKMTEAEALEAQKAKAKSEQMVKELEMLKAKQTDRGIVLTVGDLLFETGKAKLSPRARKSIVKLAEYLKKNPTRNILIEGHTDNIGSDEFNLALSKKRGDSVEAALIDKGIAPERITTRGYGKQHPIAPNDTKLGRQNNRRVEVIILKEGVNSESVVR